MTLAGSSELHEAVNTVWVASSLDADFNTYWDAGEDSEHNVLNDGDAGKEIPFPYCVFTIEAGSVQSRMSGEGAGKQLIQDVPVQFTIHAKLIDGDTRTAKEIAADLVEKVMKVFGGHPTVSPEPLVLDNAKHLITQFISDFGWRGDDDIYSWIINYNVRLDAPVAV